MTADPEIRFFKDPMGHNIAYAVHGDGPLVMCPTWWISHVEKDWAQPPFREFFERLGEGLRVVRYDRPGVGLSDRDVPARTFEAEVGLLTALIDEVGADRLSFFAISCGGPPALAYAAALPERVDKMCMFGTYSCGADLGPTDVQAAMASLVRAHWGLGSQALADIFLPGEPREVVDLMAAYQRDGADVRVAEELLKLTYAMDATEFLDRITAECLIFHRRGDRAVPYEAGRRLATGLRNARLVTLEGAVHPPWIGGTDVAARANAFLRGTVTEPTRADPAALPCTFDEANRRLIVDGSPVTLTPLEFGVLQMLVAAAGQVVTRDDLLAEVWGQQFEGSNKIDAVIRNLRKKLGAYAPSISTVIGHGYRFEGWTAKP